VAGARRLGGGAHPGAPTPIAALVRDPGTERRTRDKLALVLAARAFAADSLGFPARAAFTRYTDIGRDTLVLVLSAARRDTLAAHAWWFPVVGRVPYKGFFALAAAEDEARRLRARGLDTYLRPASAFSTLGWFDDPLLNTTLAQDSVDLVDTVIHELAHNAYYAPGQAPFNESFASFAGARGAERFFRGAATRRARAGPRRGGRTRAGSAPSGRATRARWSRRTRRRAARPPRRAPRRATRRGAGAGRARAVGGAEARRLRRAARPTRRAGPGG
jgi:predicted aminopeptidase